MYIAYYTLCNMGKNIMSKNGEKSLQKWTILMLLLRNLPVHSIIRVSKLPLFGTNFYATDTVFTSIFPTFASCHLISIFSYIHTYKNSHGKGKFPRINSFILFLEKCYYRNYSSYTQMIKEQYFPLKCYSNIGSPTKKKIAII